MSPNRPHLNLFELTRTNFILNSQRCKRICTNTYDAIDFKVYQY